MKPSHPRSLLALVVGVSLTACQGSSVDAEPVVSEALASASGVNATIGMQSDWGAGYCANVTVANGGTGAVTSWTVVIALNSTLSNLWGAAYIQSGSQITVTPQGYNAGIAPGASVSFGFCGTGSGRPTLSSVTATGDGTGTPTSYSLTVAVSGGGSTSPAAGTYSYASGTAVKVTATASSGYTFTGWSGAASGTTNPATVALDADKTLTATFAPVTTTTYTLAINVSGSGATTPAAGSYTYNAGATASVTATAASGYTFTGWTGAASGTTNPVSVTMDADKALTATFTASQPTCTVAPGSQIGTFTDPNTVFPIAPPNPPGMSLRDTDGNLMNAHGGGIIKVCDTYYLHGQYFPSNSTSNNFAGFAMYSSKDLATWKNEGIVLPQQSSGLLGPNRKGERPHIIRCPATGEFVLFAHAADTTYQVDKEVVYATSSTVNGQYSFKGALAKQGAPSSCTGTAVPPSSCSSYLSVHSDMSAFTDGNSAYVLTESGWVYTLASDCHSWVSATRYSAVNGTSSGVESPTVFKAGSTYYWIGSSKTGWRANDNFYSTAPAMTGPWTYQGYLAPQGSKTWMTQSTWVLPVVGSSGTVYVYWGDHWYGNQDTTAPGKHNDLATYVFQPIVFNGTAISLPTYNVSWKLDVGAGTWSR